MTEEAKRCVEIIRYCSTGNDGNHCKECPYLNSDTLEKPCVNILFSDAADLIESLSAQLEQVTRERDALQVEIDVLNEEYYAGIHTIRPAVDAEPVRHGYWIPQDNTHTKFMCSDCKGRNHDGSGKYCSECGCKMDAEVNNYGSNSAEY